jgi:small-conductance mechanosensitive channel
MRILLGLIAGILLWIILKAGRRIIRASVPRFSALKPMMPWLPTIAFIAWIIYAFWLISFWFFANAVYPSLVLFLFALLAVLFAWFVLRDVMAGLVFGSRGQFSLNNRISFGDTAGKIIGKGITHITVRTDRGYTARIPYSCLSGEVVSERSEDTASDYYRVLLSLEKTNSSDQIQSAITREVLCIPWASFGSAPIVRIKSETDAVYEFEVLFKSLNSRHAARVKRALRSWASAGDAS